MSYRQSARIVIVLLGLVGAAPVPKTVPSQPKVFDDLIQCQSIVADAARLACFDKAVSSLATAANQGEVRVIDKEQVNQTRRALFGFTMPSLDLFSAHSGLGERPEHRKNSEDELREIQAKIATVRTSGDGNYAFSLDDGSHWEQTEDVALGRTPRPGDEVVIRRGVLGSFKMTIGNGPALKVQRIG